MRNNSGDDEKRNNLRDPTLREKQDRPGKASVANKGGQRTTGMGSSKHRPDKGGRG